MNNWEGQGPRCSLCLLRLRGRRASGCRGGVAVRAGSWQQGLPRRICLQLSSGGRSDLLVSVHTSRVTGHSGGSFLLVGANASTGLEHWSMQKPDPECVANSGVVPLGALLGLCC